MDDLANAFAVLVADPPIPAEDVAVVVGRAEHARRRRSRRRGLVGAAAVLVVAVGASLTVIARPDDLGLQTDGQVAPAPPQPEPESTPTSMSTSIDPTTLPSFPFTPPEGFVAHPDQPTLFDAGDDGTEAVTFTASHFGSLAGAPSATINLTILSGSQIEAAVAGSSSSVELAGRVTNGTEFRIEDIGGRAVAVHDNPTLGGGPSGVPGRTGALYLFAVGPVVVEVSATAVDAATIGPVIESIDDAVILALAPT